MARTVDLPAEVRERLQVAELGDLLDLGIAARRQRDVVELRARQLEHRENDDGTVHLTGYATTWDTWYDVAGGPPWGWSESIARGAATKALAERDDTRFLVNHDGIALARTKSRTLTLVADELGLLVDIPALDVQRSSAARDLWSAIDRGDVDQMSFAFLPTRQEWNEDYTERTITELRLYDVSAVNSPANPATIIAARSARLEVAELRGMPLSLAVAQAAAIS